MLGRPDQPVQSGKAVFGYKTGVADEWRDIAIFVTFQQIEQIEQYIVAAARLASTGSRVRIRIHAVYG